MSHQQIDPRHPDPMTGAALPQQAGTTASYRRWANVLVWIAAVVAVLAVAAAVLSVVFLVQADADTSNAALGYLAIVLWVGIMAAIPVVLGTGIPGLVMKARVRRERRAGLTHS
jgi:negative regulator of sigma E activity